MKLIYSVSYTVYDPQVRAHRQSNTWISGCKNQSLTRAGIERIIRRDQPQAIVVQTQVFTDERF